MLIIQGAGDIATGVAHRLHKAGYKILMTELETPTVIRRTVALAQAVYSIKTEVEGLIGQKANLKNWAEIINNGKVPILTGVSLKELEKLPCKAFIEATISKKKLPVINKNNCLTIALGPGYIAGKDVKAVIETARGHYLGSVIYKGEALKNTGIPGEIGGYTFQRLIKAPTGGVVEFFAEIGDLVAVGQVIANVNGLKVKAHIKGILRGAIKSGLLVKKGLKIGDIDPRAEKDYIDSISDKARSVAGGVLEALLYFKVLP